MRNYNRLEFTEYLQNVKNQEYNTAYDNACMIATFVNRKQKPEEFITSYAKPNSYNNALNAIKHYSDFLGIPRPNLKQKRRSPDALIIAPKLEEMQRAIREIKALDVKTYVALCATVGLRPERLRLITWAQI